MFLSVCCLNNTRIHYEEHVTVIILYERWLHDLFWRVFFFWFRIVCGVWIEMLRLIAVGLFSCAQQIFGVAHSMLWRSLQSNGAPFTGDTFCLFLVSEFDHWVSMSLAHLILTGEKWAPVSLIYLYLMATIIIALHKFCFVLCTVGTLPIARHTHFHCAKPNKPKSEMC